MPALTEPVVAVEYACGCTWSDTTPLDGLIVPGGTDSRGVVYGPMTLVKRIGFVHNALETLLFRLYQTSRAEFLSTGALDRNNLIAALETILGHALSPAKKTAIQNATIGQLKDAAYDRLIDVQEAVTRAAGSLGTVFPEVPPICAEHNSFVRASHTSYLSPV